MRLCFLRNLIHGSYRVDGYSKSEMNTPLIRSVTEAYIIYNSYPTEMPLIQHAYCSKKDVILTEYAITNIYSILSRAIWMMSLLRYGSLFFQLLAYNLNRTKATDTLSYFVICSYSFPSFLGIPEEAGYTFLRLSLALTNDRSFQHIAYLAVSILSREYLGHS